MIIFFLSISVAEFDDDNYTVSDFEDTTRF